MSTINRLSSVDALQPGDLMPIWDGSNGDTRKASMTTLLAYITSNFVDPDYTTRIIAPSATGFTIDAGSTGDSLWLIVNPVADYAAGSIWLPPSTSAVDGQEIVVTFTAAVTALSVTSVGATVSGFTAGAGDNDTFLLRYNTEQLTWYAISSIGSGSVSYTPAGTGAVVRTVQEKDRDIVGIKDFGVVANGTVDDSAAMVLAIASAKLLGHGLRASAGDIIHLGTFADSGVQVKFLIDFDDFTFETNNCEFTANASINSSHAGSNSQILFKITGSECNIGDFRITGSANVKTIAGRAGITPVWIHADGANNRNIDLGTMICNTIYTGIVVSSSAPNSYRTRGIRFKTLFIDDGFYGLNCVENGDSVRGNIDTSQVVRSYFVYGVTDHKNMTLATRNTYTAGGTINLSQCVIARLTRDTSAITIDYSATDEDSSSASVDFNHIHDDATASIRDVTVNFDITKGSTAAPVINFATFEAGSTTPQAVATGKAFDNIRLGGTSNNTSSDPLVLTTAMDGGTISRIFIDQNLMKAFNGPCKEYQIFRDDTTMISEAALGTFLVDVPVGHLQFNDRRAKFTVIASEDLSVQTGRNFRMEEFWVSFVCPSTGTVIVHSATSKDSLEEDTGVFNPVFTIATGGAGSFYIRVSETGTPGYSGGVGSIKVYMEVFDWKS